VTVAVTVIVMRMSVVMSVGSFAEPTTGARMLVICKTSSSILQSST